MKLKINNASYNTLKEGHSVLAFAINDDVSTTRKDPARQRHRYESRYSVVRAMLHRTRRASVVCDRCRVPLKVSIGRLIPPQDHGLDFGLELKPCGGAE